MTQPRNASGRWRKPRTYGIAFIATSLIGFGTVAVGQSEKNTMQFERLEQTVQVAIETPEQRLDKKIESLTNEILDRLKASETPGHKQNPGELFYTNDPRESMKPACARFGGKRPVECDSWGLYQFKIATIIHYAKKLRGVVLTDIEAIVLSQNESEARKLAAEIIVQVDGGIWEWMAAKKTAENEAWFKDKVSDLRELLEIRDGKKPNE